MTKPRRMRYNITSRKVYYLHGGVMGGSNPRNFKPNSLRLSSPSTLFFTLKGRTGRYIGSGGIGDNILKWEDYNVN